MFGSTLLSLLAGYTEIIERLRERLGWGEGLEPNDDSKKEVPLPMLNIGCYLFKSLLLVHQFVLITPVLKVHPGEHES
jgi:hypothetical protein